MKAVICTKYGSPDVFEIRDTKKPAPKPDELCVRVHATAVTSSDSIVRGFKVPWQFWLPMGLAIGFSKPRQPILGMVFSGEVDEIGRDVKSFKPGDSVFGFDRFRFGAYAEYKCVFENGIIAEKPIKLSHIEAAAIPFGGLLALHYLRKAGNLEAKRVLIYGASGAVGTSAVQLSRSHGAVVTGVCSNSNAELVRSLGAVDVIDYVDEDASRRLGEYDFIFDAVGKAKSSPLKLHLQKMANGKGRYQTVDDGHPAPTQHDLEYLGMLAGEGKLLPVIDRNFSLDQIRDAHEYVDMGYKRGNVVISV